MGTMVEYGGRVSITSFSTIADERSGAPHPPYDPSLDKAAILGRFKDSHRQAGRTWHAALHNDPVVRAFIDRPD